MPEIVDADAYIARLLAAPRPGGENLLAFYEHRLGVIGTDPRLLLIPLDDHLVHRGDGVFETLKYVDGRLYQVAPHFERMERSAAAIHLAPPCSWDEAAELTLAVCRAGGADTGMVRVIVGRGPGGFGIDPAECPVPSLTIVAYRFHPRPAEAFTKGVTAFRTSIPAKQNYLARIKSIDYLPNVLMKREATMRGEDYLRSATTTRDFWPRARPRTSAWWTRRAVSWCRNSTTLFAAPPSCGRWSFLAANGRWSSRRCARKPSPRPGR